MVEMHGCTKMVVHEIFPFFLLLYFLLILAFPWYFKMSAWFYSNDWSGLLCVVQGNKLTFHAASVKYGCQTLKLKQWWIWVHDLLIHILTAAKMCYSKALFSLMFQFSHQKIWVNYEWTEVWSTETRILSEYMALIQGKKFDIPCWLCCWSGFIRKS